MADKKISALTGATTPLAGTEVLPIVQGGSTVKVSVANLTVGRDTTVANLLTNGDITVRNAGSVIVGYAQNSAGWFDFAGSANVNGTQVSSGATTPIRFLPAGVESLRLQTNGDVTLQTGNVVMAWPGKGIDFSANSNAPGMTSELLTWYEEGTWTPVLDATTTSPTVAYSNRTARYTRVGRLVTIHAWINISSQSGGSGNAIITGLPFTSSNTAANISVVNLGVLQNIDPGAGNLNAAYVVNNTTTIALAASPQNTGGWSDLSIAALGATNINIMLSASYLV